MDGVGVCRPLHACLCTRVPCSGPLRRLPEPVPETRSSAATSSLADANYVQAADRPEVLGRVAPGAGCSWSCRCRSCWSSRSPPRWPSTVSRLRFSSFFRISIFLPYAVPAVVATLMWGFIYGTALRAGRQHQRVLRLGRFRHPLSGSWILVAIGNIVTWEFIGYNMLIFYAALRDHSRPTCTRRPALDGAGALSGSSGTSRFPSIRGAIVHRRHLLRHRQLPALQRTEHPQVARTQLDQHLLHAEHVRIQPVLRRPAVQLLGSDRHHHGADHDAHRLRRPAVRFPEGCQAHDDCRRVLQIATAPHRESPRPSSSGPRGRPAWRTSASRSSSPSLWVLLADLRAAPARLAVRQLDQDPARPAFELFGLWFSGDFALWDNIVETLTYNDGVFVRWLANTVLYVVVGRGRRHAARDAGRLRAGQVRLPREACRLRSRPRRSRHSRNRPGRADLPDVQPARSDQYAVVDHHPVPDQPVRPLPVWVYAIDAVPTEMLEAARIDGAGEFRTFFTISARLLAPGLRHRPALHHRGDVEQLLPAPDHAERLHVGIR